MAWFIKRTVNWYNRITRRAATWDDLTYPWNDSRATWDDVASSEN